MLVSKYTFPGPKITQKAINNTLNYFFYLNSGHFSCFNISVSNKRNKEILVFKYTFAGPRIRENNLKYVSK